MHILRSCLADSEGHQPIGNLNLGLICQDTNVKREYFEYKHNIIILINKSSENVCHGYKLINILLKDEDIKCLSTWHSIQIRGP